MSPFEITALSREGVIYTTPFFPGFRRGFPDFLTLLLAAENRTPRAFGAIRRATSELTKEQRNSCSELSAFQWQTMRSQPTAVCT